MVRYSCLLQALISRIHSFWTGGILSYPNSSIHKFARYPLRILFMLSRLRCNRHSLLLNSISLESSESKILYAAPVAIRPRTHLISFCTVQLRTLCAARSLAAVYFCTTSGQALCNFACGRKYSWAEHYEGFWAFVMFHHAPIRRKRSDSNTNINKAIFCQF